MSNETDKELLELAAKAAGIDGWYERAYLTFIVRGEGPWRPLDDDGDALRLAVKLGIIPGCDDEQASDIISAFSDLFFSGSGLSETRADPHAAIRGYIVREAAKIGRMME